MKTSIALFFASLAFTQLANAAALNPNHDIIICAKKPARAVHPMAYELLMLKQRENVVYYENSNNGQEKDPITAKAVVGTKLIVQHELGTKETVTFDLQNGTANWVEDAYPNNVQVYRYCMSMANYNFDILRAWLNNTMATPAWNF